MSNKEIAACAEDLRQSLETGSLSERKAFIRNFVKEIRITGDNALMTYSLPMMPQGLTEEKIPVLAIERYGGR